VRVCFVCTGNICRSPIADVVLRRMAADTRLEDGTSLSDHLEVDSAGTGNWHAGEPMDPRAAEVLAAHGYVDHGHRARAFEAGWFDRYDLVVALARSHQQTLRSLARHRAGKTERDEAKLVLLRSYDRRAGGQVDVPDPYYGEYADFEECLTMVEAGCRGLVAHLLEVVAGQAEQVETQTPEGSRVTNDSAS
jgi:protein-tyrosine phosphatase